MSYLAVTQSDGLERLSKLLSSVREFNFGQLRIQVRDFSDSCQILLSGSVGFRGLYMVSLFLFS